MKRFQLRHYGIEIPSAEQPKCPICGGGMSLNIMKCNGTQSANWYCLRINDYDYENDVDDTCSGEMSFTEWKSTHYISDTVEEHFSTEWL